MKNPFYNDYLNPRDSFYFLLSRIDKDPAERGILENNLNKSFRNIEFDRPVDFIKIFL